MYRKNRPNDSRGDLALIMAAGDSALRLSSNAIAEHQAAQGERLSIGICSNGEERLAMAASGRGRLRPAADDCEKDNR